MSRKVLKQKVNMCSAIWQIGRVPSAFPHQFWTLPVPILGLTAREGYGNKGSKSGSLLR